jgi:hypothetical protein
MHRSIATFSGGDKDARFIHKHRFFHLRYEYNSAIIPAELPSSSTVEFVASHS